MNVNLVKSNRASYEKVLYNPLLNVVERSSSSGPEYVTAVYVDGDIKAERIISHEGTKYFVSKE